jgi:hypothetical protein
MSVKLKNEVTEDLLSVLLSYGFVVYIFTFNLFA